MTQILQDLKDYLETTLAKDIAHVQFEHEELTITVMYHSLLKVLVFLRDDTNCQFRQLIFIAGADYPDRNQRFDIVYHLLSLRYNQRIRVKLKISAEILVPSATYVFSSANWFEREIWDMYGIVFDGHPDLRRLLTDYGFDGHPLRKDFPLTGYLEVRYDDERKRVIYESVKLTQAFRVFDFLSPWEGEKYSKNNVVGS